MSATANNRKMDSLKVFLFVENLEELQAKTDQLADMPLRVNHLSVEITVGSPASQLKALNEATATLAKNDTELAASVDAATPKT